MITMLGVLYDACKWNRHNQEETERRRAVNGGDYLILSMPGAVATRHILRMLVELNSNLRSPSESISISLNLSTALFSM